MLFYLLPLDFRISYGLFHGLNVLSALLIVLLFSIYQSSRRNCLLRSACVLCLAVNGILFWNFLQRDGHLTHESDCQIQAVALNYCYIALHGHFCFFMVDSCFAALGWSFLGVKGPGRRTRCFLLTSWIVPLLPTALVVWRIVDGGRPAVLPRSFYCALASPSWPLYRLWFFLFSVPGLYFSFHLLYRTWRYRRTTLHLSHTTQIDHSELFRLLLAILLYLALIGMSLGKSPRLRRVGLHVHPVAQENPFLHPDFCIKCDRGGYVCALLCPNLKSYLPVLVGCMLFAMYGFGAIATSCYRRAASYIVRSSRRQSVPARGDGGRKSQQHVPSGRRISFSSGAPTNGSASASGSEASVNGAVLPMSCKSLPFGTLPASANDCINDSVNASSLSLTPLSRALSVLLHPNLVIAPRRHQHHPSLPSIDEDLEVLYMASGHQPVPRRNMQRRFSEPMNMSAAVSASASGGSNVGNVGTDRLDESDRQHCTFIPHATHERGTAPFPS